MQMFVHDPRARAENRYVRVECLLKWDSNISEANRKSMQARKSMRKMKKTNLTKYVFINNHNFTYFIFESSSET